MIHEIPRFGTPEYAEFIAARRAEAVAALTLRGRLARHWAWFWDVYLVLAAVVIAYVAIMLFAREVMFS